MGDVLVWGRGIQLIGPGGLDSMLLHHRSSMGMETLSLAAVDIVYCTRRTV